MQILVVDDSACDNTLLKRVLNAEGYEVVCAFNGQEALDRLKEIKPSLIISDVMMPVMDGFEFLENMKSDDLCAKIPVIMLSSASSVIRTAKEMGIEDFLSKPIDKELLLEKVKKLVN